jgi:hypothetical protein
MMKKKLIQSFVIAFILAGLLLANQFKSIAAVDDFLLLLGRPTDESITINVIPDQTGEISFEYGLTSGVYGSETGAVPCTANEPVEDVIDGLASNSHYYYRVRYRAISGDPWTTGTEHSFHTQRPPGSTFTFTIISDSHLGQYGGQTADELALYERTLQNAELDNPDFHIDLGDASAMDPSPLGTGMTEAEARAAYLFQRPYLNLICHSIPFFMVIGNHENEEGWNWDDTFTPPDQSLALVGIEYRKLFYPNPISDDFYTGNMDPLPSEIGGDYNREDYFAWEWGDALFVVIEPYHYTAIWPSEGVTYGGEGTDGEAQGDRWDWTLGIEQYLWFKSTLENSDATFKFVFTHHVTGGNIPYGRGGIKAAPYFEWGGKNADDTWGWDTERPAAEGWDLPIHQLMVANGVSIFFHGHDHEYAYETLDDIVYLECPKPDDAGYTWEPYSYGHNEGHYPDALEIENSGHIRVSVSPDEVVTEYVRSYLPGDGTNGVIAHTVTVDAPYTGPTQDLTLEVDPTEGGITVPSAGVHTYPENDVITIEANPAYGYLFDHWSGDVAASGSAITTVTMDATKTVTAHFVLSPNYTLTMAVEPTGTGTTNPATGDNSYPENTVVTLTAYAASGYVFDYWDGDVDDVNSPTTTVTVDGNKTVTAHFREAIPGEIVYLGDIGTATNKTSSTSLQLTTTSAVEAGDAIIIGCATDPYQDLGISVSDATGNNYEQAAISISYQHARVYIFAAYDVNPLSAGSNITVTLTDAITAKTAVASVFRGLESIGALDQSLGYPVAGAEEMVSGTVATVGPTGMTTQTNELVVGVVGTEGPVEDDAGTWDYSFQTGPRAGTTGGDAATNMTVSMGFKLVPEINTYSAQKSDITSRYWGATIATFKSALIPGEGILGDVNGDDNVNSTDALIVLSCDVGINVSQFCPMNCGDANADGLVNSTDALIILSYDVGMSVPFPVGTAGCPSEVAPCAGCNP